MEAIWCKKEPKTLLTWCLSAQTKKWRTHTHTHKRNYHHHQVDDDDGLVSKTIILPSILFLSAGLRTFDCVQLPWRPCTSEDIHWHPKSSTSIFYIQSSHVSPTLPKGRKHPLIREADKTWRQGEGETPWFNPVWLAACPPPPQLCQTWRPPHPRPPTHRAACHPSQRALAPQPRA